MEGMAEGAESQAVKPKTERPPTKVTEVDHGLPIERCNLLEIQAKLASSESEWTEELSSLRMPLGINKVGLLPGFPLVFARIFDRSKDEQCNPWSTSGEVFPMRNKGMMVEELTLKNYKSCNVSYSDGGFNTEPAVACEIGQAHSIRLQWEHLPEKLGEGNISSHSQLTCKDETTIDLNDGLPSKQNHHDSDKEKSKNVRIDKSWEQTPVLVQNPEHAMASRDLVHSDRYHHLNGPPSMPMLGGRLRTTISSSYSGFPEFFERNTSRGKGTSFRGAAPVQNSSAAVKPALRRNVLVSANNIKTDLMRAYFKLSGGSYSDCTHDSINLRDWIFPGCQSLDKPERYLILSQILELVDLAHSQGVLIKDLRPSSFIIFSNNQVKYVGSSSFHIPSSNSDNNKDYMNSSVDGSLKRRRQQLEPFFFGTYFKCASYSENVLHSDGTPPIMHKKFGDALELCDHNRSLPCLLKPESTTDMSTISRIPSHSKCGLVVHENGFEDHDTGKRIGMGLPSPSPQQFSLNDRQLEERWYVSPEEINGKACSSASNIYSLGVLLFELFCCSESWEVHASSMSDLKHRILPPSFLVENPKEAGFCLWLLHPEPLFRPKAREVLQSDLILQSLKLSTDKHSTPFLDEDYADSELLLHFLGTLKEEKHIHASKLFEDIGCLEEDMKEVEIRQSLRNNKKFQKISEEVTACNKLKIQGNNFIERTALAGENKSSLSTNSYGPSGSPVRCSSEARMSKHMKQLEDAYFSMRSKLKLSGSDNAAREGRGVLRNHRKHFPMLGAEGSQNSVKDDPRGMFFDGFCKYARYNRFEVRGVLRNGDIVSSPNVICSLSFDRDEEYFAAAGVSKKIKIFEFQSLLNDNVDIHYPAIEMSSKSKLSCVCWNNYIKNFLASTDYDGTVQLWDATAGQGFTQYVEHQKRAWSVDFSLTDPTKFSSGSDDCSVKLWSINEKNSVGTIRNHANVCCVQFSPYSRHLLAFGSADYKVFCYDLRNIRVPWCALAGHGKAVSYVKFLDGKTVVSASTDNTLKLWDLNKSDISTSACILTMNGHTNEKNFVGLTVSDGYIACGSETNEVYAYYKSLPMPIASYKFGSIDSLSGQGKVEDNGLFVSSVCWKGKSNMAIAANSNGNIKLLQLI